VNSARRVLCGGRSVMSVPTAIVKDRAANLADAIRQGKPN
jgi:hypothetical protein